MCCTHKHVQCDEDISEELFGLLSSVKKLHNEKVVNGKMKPDRFIEMFCDVNHSIDCDRACCKNAHRMNVNIVHNLYTQEKKLLDEYLYNEPFVRKDLAELLHRYLTEPRENESGTHFPITLGGKFTEEQMTSLAYIAHTHRLFLLPEGMNAHTAMEALLKCTHGFSVKVSNIRNLAVFFDELLANNMISHDWQSVMGKGGFLLSHRTNKPVASSTLSSALNRTKTSQTALQASIRKAIREMQKWNTTDI